MASRAEALAEVVEEHSSPIPVWEPQKSTGYLGLCFIRPDKHLNRLPPCRRSQNPAQVANTARRPYISLSTVKVRIAMSSEPVVPLNHAEREEESPYVAPGTDRDLRRDENLLASRTDRLLEPEYRDARALGQIPGGASKAQGAAQTVGSAVGRAVNTARDLPRRLSEMKDRFTVIRGRTQGEAGSTAQEVRQTAKQKMDQARSRVQFYANEYPVQFILGVGAACFVVGVFLRVWRSNRRD